MGPLFHCGTTNIGQASIHSTQRRGHVSIETCIPSTVDGELILNEVVMSEPSYEELKAKLAQLEKEVETKKRSGDLIFKVGEKGGVSVYGLGRFPVTLYYEQWNRLLGAANDIRQFLEENKSKLKLKETA